MSSPSTARKEHERERVEDLRLALHGVHAPFTCSGTFVPERPIAIAFPDGTQIPVLREKNSYEQEEALDPLVKRCSRAAFGAGRKTRYDSRVRDALQLKSAGGGFSVIHFDPAAAGILEKVRRELTPHAAAPPTAELYNLNIYAGGGHFVPHKDTPRGDDMLGTLVVCLPSRFSNGAFVVKHHGILHTYDWEEAIDRQTIPHQIHWAAFFGDVDHQVERVWSGLRLTLTYLLRRPKEESPELPAAAPEPLARKLAALLNDRAFMAKGGTLAFPCAHLYHQNARSQKNARALTGRTISALKGRDHEVARAAIAAGLEVTLYPYLVETCTDETWQLEHFPTASEEAKLDDRMDPWKLEEALAIKANAQDASDFDVTWVDPPPHFNSPPTMYAQETYGDPAQAVDPDLPALKHFHYCQFSVTGYFGNEGSDVDFYIYCALHVAIPPFGEGVRAKADLQVVRPAGRPRKRPAK